MNEPTYYTKNGLSPNQAFEKGLMSVKETKGFYKGNVIKYLTRSEYKDDEVNDLIKARNYLNLLIELAKNEQKRNEKPN